MKKILDVLTEEMGKAFEAAGYEAALGRVTLSNRPDLCEYQCNGAMAGAKKYKKAPIMIANDVAARLADSPVFKEAAAVAPGFLNLKLSESFLLGMVKAMDSEPKFGLEMPEKPKKIMIDYGGANVAKPLHVGHLRPAIIGESIKRISRY
ncbi:MAG: arginine--tRNA ligase, partial [Lachnospiraceae bacterium]|nr:arginine--tRNA ligase [Lachnospiraceae bacterium]